MRVILVLLALSGCASIPEAPREVRIPVPVPCLDRIPDKPEFITDAQLNQLPDKQFVLALRIDQLKLRDDNDMIRALMESCVKPSSP